jgi:hypothetical protein
LLVDVEVALDEELDDEELDDEELDDEELDDEELDDEELDDEELDDEELDDEELDEVVWTGSQKMMWLMLWSPSSTPSERGSDSKLPLVSANTSSPAEAFSNSVLANLPVSAFTTTRS